MARPTPATHFITLTGDPDHDAPLILLNNRLRLAIFDNPETTDIGFWFGLLKQFILLALGSPGIDQAAQVDPDILAAIQAITITGKVLEESLAQRDFGPLTEPCPCPACRGEEGIEEVVH